MCICGGRGGAANNCESKVYKCSGAESSLCWQHHAIIRALETNAFDKCSCISLVFFFWPTIFVSHASFAIVCSFGAKFFQFVFPNLNFLFQLCPHYMDSMRLVIPLHSLYGSIHTKDESKRGTAFAFIFGVN